MVLKAEVPRLCSKVVENDCGGGGGEGGGGGGRGSDLELIVGVRGAGRRKMMRMGGVGMRRVMRGRCGWSWRWDWLVGWLVGWLMGECLLYGHWVSGGKSSYYSEV